MLFRSNPVDDALDVGRRYLVELLAQKAVKLFEHVRVTLAGCLSHFSIPSTKIFIFDGSKRWGWFMPSSRSAKELAGLFPHLSERDHRVSADGDGRALSAENDQIARREHQTQLGYRRGSAFAQSQAARVSGRSCP